MLKPGLYEQVINDQLNRELNSSEKLDKTETPRILSHYIGELFFGQFREYPLYNTAARPQISCRTAR